MARFIRLEAGVLGLLHSSPRLVEVAACRAWLARMDAAGSVVVIPEVTLYEARGEPVGLNARAKLRRLDRLGDVLPPAQVTPEAWLKAAEFWALVRRSGMATAEPPARDGEAILGGVAAPIGAEGDRATIAPTQVGQLARLPGIEARSWDRIAPRAGAHEEAPRADGAMGRGAGSRARSGTPAW